MVKQTGSMKKTIWAIVLLGVVALSAMAFLKKAPEPRSEVEIFNGKIDHPILNGAILLGNITYDRNCESVGNGLTNCDAGVKTEKYGVINFNYVHNMSKHPCLVSGDKVLLKVKVGQNAYVIR